MTSPLPGVTYPSPRTWEPGDFVTVDRLRGDMTNLADLFAGGARPMLLAQNLSNPTVNGTVSLSLVNSVRYLNTWNVPIGTASPANYNIPFAGYWLLQADVTITAGSNISNQFRYAVGFGITQESSGGARFEGASVPADGVNNDLAGGAACDLFEFSTYAEDNCVASVYVICDSSATCTLNLGQTMFEWVGLPTDALTYPPPGIAYGTVVANPRAAAPFPSGQGTTLGSAIAAGGTVAVVNDSTGMVVNGTLGLDYVNGVPYQPFAEAGTITSVSGGTIGITAAGYAHAQGAPVAVPVSAAFLNQQDRDIIRFLSAPPLLKAYATTTQSIASSGFPPTVGGNPGNQITHLSVTSYYSGGDGIDTYNGFASNAYTIPVAGAYLVYGSIPYAGAVSTVFACGTGVSVNGGTIQWGTTMRFPSEAAAKIMTPTFRRLMRFNAGDTLTLWAFQGSGSNMSTVNIAAATFAKLIAVFRAF